MFTIEYFDSDNRYRCTSADTMEDAVRACKWLSSVTVGASPLAIVDRHGKRYLPDGTPRQ